MSPRNSFGSWEEHGRGILDTCERLQRDLAAIRNDTDEQLRSVRNAVAETLQRIITHIEICKQRDRAEEQFRASLTRVFADIERRRDSDAAAAERTRESDLGEAKRIRAEDLADINKALAAITLSIKEKTSATDKLLWAGIIAWAGSATAGLVWTLGKLLKLM